MANQEVVGKIDGAGIFLGKLLGEPNYVEQKPYVGEDGIYVPLHPYVPEGQASAYRCLISKELFVEAYNKYILNK